LADRIRCSSHFVSGIERGVDSPSLLTLEALARALGTSVGELTREETSATEEALHQLAAVLGDRRDPRLLQVLRDVAQLYDTSRSGRTRK
jgi:transcriptional regulator with XRE-family HTH domain